MRSTIFAVADEPYCLWEADLVERAQDFLDGLDPEFFSYVLDAYSATEDKKRASVGVRLALHHATETLFSLLGAFLQAPDSPYAWVAKCSNSQLRTVVKRISSGDTTLITKWSLPFAGWEQVASAVLQCFDPATDIQKYAIKGFGQVWARLADDFVSDVSIDEYNATKHGFRTRAGGFKLQIGTQEAPGVPAPQSEMKTIGQSDFGSMFYKVERLNGKGGPHIRSRRTSVNWAPERDALLLQLVQYSINNVISALKIANGISPGNCKFLHPESDEDFLQPWKYGTGVTSMNFDFTIDESVLPEVTKADVLRRLRASQAVPTAGQKPDLE